MDQSPIGKTSRSTPATYIKVFDEIRKLYATLPLARMRGYTASRFSFNNEGGRCETCEGQGVIKVEMNFLPTSYIPCSDCHGLRYNAQTMEVLYNGKSIGDVMNLTDRASRGVFQREPKDTPPALIAGGNRAGLPETRPAKSDFERRRSPAPQAGHELTRGSSRALNDRIRIK